jgi:hypothetical protein
MKLFVVGKSLDGHHLATWCAKSRNQELCTGLPSSQTLQAPAITGVTTLLDAEPAEITGQSSQTLAESRFGFEGFSVDPVNQWTPPAESRRSTAFHPGGRSKLSGSPTRPIVAICFLSGKPPGPTICLTRGRWAMAF